MSSKTCRGTTYEYEVRNGGGIMSDEPYKYNIE
jgi:hypothetical protein